MDLVLKNIQTSLSEVKPEYKTMLKNIDKNMPMVQQASSNFYKSHSQFMGVTLDVTAITPIRSIKHTLAEVDKTKSALQEAQIRMKKKSVELKMKQRELLECQDDLQREMLKNQDDVMDKIILKAAMDFDDIQYAKKRIKGLDGS